MLLKLDSSCRYGSEEVGTLWGVAIEPRERLFLRAIVERPQARPLVRVKVPFTNILRAGADQVVLDLDAGALEAMPTHHQHSGEDGRRSRRRRGGDEVMEKILTRATRVHCRDGEAGHLVQLSVDDRTGDVEEIGFELGALIPRVVNVPVSDIDEVEDSRIMLGLDRDALADLSDGLM